MPNDLFESAKELVAHAREHTRDLEARWKAFLGAEPYSLIERNHSEYGKVVIGRLDQPVPRKLKLVAFDAANALRAALDQAVYASSVRLVRANPRSTRFPFGDTSADFERELDRVRHVHDDIRALLRAYKPYKGGDNGLWALNKLRNQKIHRVLIPMVADGPAFEPRNMRISAGRFAIFPKVAGLAENEFALFSSTGNIEYTSKPSFDISIAEIDGVRGPAAIGFLDKAARKVESIVLAVEAETEKIAIKEGRA